MDANRISGYVAERIKRFLLVAIVILLGLLLMPSAMKSASNHKPQAEVSSTVIERVGK
jgi:hypothetical protein